MRSEKSSVQRLLDIPRFRRSSVETNASMLFLQDATRQIIFNCTFCTFIPLRLFFTPSGAGNLPNNDPSHETPTAARYPPTFHSRQIEIGAATATPLLIPLSSAPAIPGT